MKPALGLARLYLPEEVEDKIETEEQLEEVFGQQFHLSDGELEETLEDEEVDVVGIDPGPTTNEIVCFLIN